MIISYLTLARQNWSHLFFGTMLMALSSFGQTYFVSLSGANFREAFHLTDGELGSAYAIGTILSAMTLTWAGRMMDYTTVRRFTWIGACVVAFACALVAVSSSVIILAIAFYFLRLGGQGLMIHTALTATARAFPTDVAKAIGILSLGMALAQALFPIGTIAITELVGWRWSWGINSIAVLVGTGIALIFLPRAADTPLKKREEKNAPKYSKPSLLRDKRLLATMPSVLAMPFVVTGLLFHQVRLAEQKGWDLGIVASSFIAFAFVQAASTLVAGPVIDKVGPSRLLPIFLAPLIIALLLIGFMSSTWIVFPYMVLMGISTAVASTLATALWVELFGPDELARVRSTVEAGVIMASGAAPIMFGFFIDAGITIAHQAIACAIYSLAASALVTRVRSGASYTHEC